MKTTCDPELFLLVIKANKGIIYKVANSYCKNSESRNELVQEIIIQLWKSFVNYNDKYEHSTWVYRIALNVAISFYRKSKKEITTPLTDNIIALAIDDEPGELEENVQLLYQFINELDELNKALMLLYLDNKTHKEIAEVLGITETNVATKIGRIKEKLKLKFSLANE